MHVLAVLSICGFKSYSISWNYSWIILELYSVESFVILYRNLNLKFVWFFPMVRFRLWILGRNLWGWYWILNASHQKACRYVCSMIVDVNLFFKSTKAYIQWNAPILSIPFHEVLKILTPPNLYKDKKYFLPSASFLMPFPSQSPLHTGNHCFFFPTTDLPVVECHTIGIIQYVPFCVRFHWNSLHCSISHSFLLLSK